MKFKSRETLGIIFAIIAYFSFSILDAIQKTAVIHYSIFQLLFIKYTFVLLLGLIEAKRANNTNFYRSNNFLGDDQLPCGQFKILKFTPSKIYYIN